MLPKTSALTIENVQNNVLIMKNSLTKVEMIKTIEMTANKLVSISRASEQGLLRGAGVSVFCALP